MVTKQGETMKWLPIIRIEENTAYVKTIRGIEPCKITIPIDDVDIGKYALCESVNGNLIMSEVEA